MFDSNFNVQSKLRHVSLKFSGESLQALANVNSSTRDWTFFNPKVGVGYALTNNSSIYTSFGRSGREPTRTDILQGDGSGIYDYNFFSVVDDKVVKAEYVNDFELGYRYSGDQASVSVNYFHMSFENHSRS